MAKYLNPFTDIGFKRLFGQEFSKALLIDFLNNLLEGEKKIVGLLAGGTSGKSSVRRWH